MKKISKNFFRALHINAKQRSRHSSTTVEYMFGTPLQFHIPPLSALRLPTQIPYFHRYRHPLSENVPLFPAALPSPRFRQQKRYLREHTASQKCGAFCMSFFNSQCKGYRFKRPVPFALPVGGNGKEVKESYEYPDGKAVGCSGENPGEAAPRTGGREVA